MRMEARDPAGRLLKTFKGGMLDSVVEPGDSRGQLPVIFGGIFYSPR